MSIRYAVLFDDGSFGVEKDGSNLLDAEKRLCYDKADEDAKFVEVEIKVTRVIHQTSPRFQVALEHSATCPTCGTQVFIEGEGEKNAE